MCGDSRVQGEERTRACGSGLQLNTYFPELLPKETHPGSEVPVTQAPNPGKVLLTEPLRAEVEAGVALLKANLGPHLLPTSFFPGVATMAALGRGSV